MKPRPILATLLALFALLTLLDRFVLVELFLRRAGLPLLLAAVEGLAIVGTGALLRRAKRVDVPLDFLLGYPVFGTALFLVGLLKIAAWTLIPLLVLGAGAGVTYLLKRYADDVESESLVLEWPALFVFAVLACGFVVAQAPPASLDELAYHLAVPHAWVLEGRALELPLLSHSYFPLGIESADLLPLTLLGRTAGGIASHFLHFFAAIATTLLVVRRTGSWLATAAIVTTPALAITAGWSLVEWPLAGLFVALYVALESDDRDTASAATAAGLLTKYTFLPFALVAWALKRRIPKWTALLGLVFFIRNLLLTANPFAPFLGADAPHVSGYRAVALADYVFEAKFIDEALGASILALPVFATGGIAIASAVLALALFFLAPSSRILVPFLVVPSLSAAPALRRRVMGALMAVAIVLQTFLVVWFTSRGSAFTLLSGMASDEEYLRKQRPSFPTIEWMDTILPPNSRTLLVGLGETYWFAHKVRGGGNFDGPRISRYLTVPAADALHERFRADGITHVAIVTVPIATQVEEKREERQTNLSPEAQRMLAQTLDRYAASVMSKGNVTLFTLR
jgi:hypothetical protein